MSKKQLEEIIASLGPYPDECRAQITMQRTTYEHLIDRMDEYIWSDLFTVGVKIKEKEGDPQIFLSKLLLPIKLYLFTPSEGDANDPKVSVAIRTMPSLLETKFKALGIYVGPLGQKLQLDGKDDIVNPFKIYVDKTERIARMICL